MSAVFEKTVSTVSPAVAILDWVHPSAMKGSISLRKSWPSTGDETEMASGSCGAKIWTENDVDVSVWYMIATVNRGDPMTWWGENCIEQSCATLTAPLSIAIHVRSFELMLRMIDPYG